VIWSAS